MSQTVLSLFTRLGSVPVGQFGTEFVKSLKTLGDQSWRQQRFEAWFREYHKKVSR